MNRELRKFLSPKDGWNIPSGCVIGLGADCETLTTVPEVGGCYIIIGDVKYKTSSLEDSKVLYIGYTTNLKKRLSKHRTDLLSYQQLTKEVKRQESPSQRVSYMCSSLAIEVYYYVQQGDQSTTLEDRMMTAYRSRYLNKPIGNCINAPKRKKKWKK